MISYILLVLNIKYPVIRFETRMYNLVFTVLLFLIPIVIFIRAFYIKNIIFKFAGIFITAISAFFSAILALFLIMNIGFILDDGYDYSFECINEILNDDYAIKAYRVNGGATTAYSVLVRQEKPLFLGLLIVRDIDFKYRQYEVDLHLDDSVLVIEECEYNLKENVYY